MARYIWQSAAWPGFTWRDQDLLVQLGQTRQSQGRLQSLADQLGLEQHAETLVEEALTTAIIEGETLDRQAIRSSVARRLGLPTAGLPRVPRHVDGLVQMLIDATGHHDRPLTAKRLWGWQAALFPTGYSGLQTIAVGRWRHSAEPMQVVSGPAGRERVHYEAPPASRVATEIRDLLRWFNAPPVPPLDGLLRAALAHLWFVTIHPFEDGNGRVARALTDMALAQDERSGRRLYSMSAQINDEREAYYLVLEQTQRGSVDVTAWLQWFLGCQQRAIERSLDVARLSLQRASFWRTHAELELNPRQRKVLGRLLDAGPDGFEGGLNNRKYVGLTSTSRETAKRDLAELVELGLLRRRPGGGRSASYELLWET
ncbi:MAG: Fic family protein [Pseudomonadota bacterium]